MNSINNLTSRTFDTLKWVLALLVVCDHYIRMTLLPAAKTMSPDFETYPWSFTITEFVSAFIQDYQVPVFFVMSGFLFCSGLNFNRSSYHRKIKSRIRSLAVPYVVFIIYGLVISLMAKKLQYGEISSDHIHPMGMLLGYGQIYPVNTPLWYIRDLMILCVLAPVIHWLLSQTRGWLLLVLTMLFLLTGHDTFLSHFTVGLCFFTIGYWFRMNARDIVGWSVKLTWWLLPCYIAIGLILIIKAESWMGYSLTLILKNFNIILAMPLTIGIAAMITMRRPLAYARQLVPITFFIYLTHHPLRELLRQAYSTYWPHVSDTAYIVSLILATALLIIGLGGVYLILRRYVPRLICFSMGQRYDIRIHTETPERQMA